MTGDAAPPQVGIFWMIVTAAGEPRLLTANCALDDAEPYGDFLTFGPGHYEKWEEWRAAPHLHPAVRTVVRAHEYEDWPRGRVVFDRSRARFILYADRKLIAPETISRIRSHFHLPPERTTVESDFHYQSAETPGASGAEGFTPTGDPLDFNSCDIPNRAAAIRLLRVVRRNLPSAADE